MLEHVDLGALLIEFSYLSNHSLMIIVLVIRIFHCLCINYRFLDSFIYTSRFFVQLNMDSSFINLKTKEKPFCVKSSCLVLLSLFLQGDAGDFAFDELAAHTLINYHKLTKELKSRFGIIEHARTYRLQY
jgi:hypothetical protein